MSQFDLAKFEQLKAVGDLPSPKGVALALIALAERPEVSLAELAHAIRADPACSARLIKAANGANGFGRRPIVSIQNALAVLGVPAVKALILGFSLLSNNRGGNCLKFDYQRYWSHSLLCGTALQALTGATQAAQTEEAFAVGLLSRIGELALATLFPERYSDILERRGQEPDSRLADLEQEAFALTHNALSAAMMLEWGMPKAYADPVCFFETPAAIDFQEGSRPFKLTHLLALADRVADVCLAAEAARHALMPQLFQLGATLSIEPGALTAICDQAAEDWVKWGALLNVPTTAVPPFEELSAPPEDAPADDAAAKRMRVLIVDDEAVTRMILRTTLDHAGYEVLEAVNGRQGLEMALELAPQMMVVDWLMPEMDGITLTRALRQTKIGRGVYLLILTGLDDDERLIEAFEAGVNDFMAKPLKPKVLTARLHAAQRVVELQQEIEREREKMRQTADELEVSNHRLQEVAMTDMLTGFPNRRYAIERIEQEWAAASRGKRPLSVMVIDIDDFKLINDSYGHDVGDTVLRQVAAALKSGVRMQDMVCRFGGDEFLVICPDTTLEAVLACAERMRHAVETAVTGSNMLRRTVSVGAAVRDAAMADFDALIKRADQGVFVAKQRGRNCVHAVQARSISD